MRLVYLLLALFLINVLPLYSQNAAVSGWVKDGENENIAYATVLLLQVSDTTITQGVSTDENGRFAFQNVVPSLYFIRASYIGKSSKLNGIDVTKDVMVGTIIIEGPIESLDEVVVTSNRPFIERKADRLVFNVENSVISQGSSWEVLKQTPGVIAINEDLKLRNQSVTVYINDRKVHLSSEEVRDLLENFPGEHLKSIEVINNPPAKYDAEGGPILNIITSKSISLGYKANVNGTYTQGIYPKYNFGTTHFYKTKKLDVFTSYNFGDKKEFKTVGSNTNFIDDTGVFSKWNTVFDKTSRAKTHALQLNLDYDLDDNNVLSFSSNLLASPDKTYDYIQNTGMRNAQNVLDSTFTTNNDLLEDKNNLSADLTFRHSFKNGGDLKINGHYTKFDYGLEQDALSNYFDPEGQFIRNFGFFTDAEQEVDIYTAQLDISSTLGSFEYETGLKGSFINSQSGIQFFNSTNSTRVLNNQLSDDYHYDEGVYAAYFSLAKEGEKLSTKLGLRAEHTTSTGTSASVYTINDLKYLELFPTLHLLYTINDNNSMSFDYSRQLGRPRYEELNPFKQYINENNYTEGNPNLLPHFSNNFNLNYTLKDEYFFDFYYRDNGHYISTLAFQDNVNLVLKDISQNVLESTSYGFDFNYGKSATRWWYLYTYISIFHEDETFTALESNNQIVTNEVNGAYFDLTNNFTLSKDGSFKGQLGITYLSGFLEGSYVIEETTNLTLGIRKSFWKDRAVFSLQANDLLNKANSRITSKYLNQDNSYFSNPETQYIRAGLTLNFGNFRLEDNERGIDKIERERLGSKNEN